MFSTFNMHSLIPIFTLVSLASAQIVVDGFSPVNASSSAVEVASSSVSLEASSSAQPYAVESSSAVASSSSDSAAYAPPAYTAASSSSAPPSYYTQPPAAYQQMSYSSFVSGGYKTMDCGYGYQKMKDGSCNPQTWVRPSLNSSEITDSNTM